MSTDLNEDTDAQSSSAVAESYSALQWRDEPPTERGWYWIEVGRGAYPVRVDPYPFDNDSEIPEGELAIWVYLEGWVGPVSSHNGRWAGPIPEPDEAESAV